MTLEENQKIRDRIVQNVGEEKASLILDDLALLGTDCQKMNEEKNTLEEKLKKSNERNEHLQSVNSSLYQQVGSNTFEQPKNEKISKKEEEKQKEVSFKSFFDKNGDFIKS